MKDFSELARIRRSMRKFTAEELTQDEVVALLRTALMSPSSKGSHSWELVVVDDKELLRQLAHCKARGAELVEGAPLAVVVLGDPGVSDAWIEDASVASTMLLLQAEDLGLGACWVQVRERFMADGKPAEDIVRGLLHIPESLRVLSIIAVGHKGMERKPFSEDHLLWEKVHINTFDAPKE
ncbi:MAG: nitroreductase family protein [Paraprevotella sp.]|nr:nitroreductase family protein [Paraprevotella sp.]